MAVRDQEIIIEMSEKMAAKARQVAAQRGLTVEELCEYILYVAAGLREPDPNDPVGAELFGFMLVYPHTTVVGHG